MRGVVSKKALRVKGLLNFCVPMSGVADDLVQCLDTLREPDHTVKDFEIEVFKWALECKFCIFSNECFVTIHKIDRKGVRGV